jgi:hypothetical protein
VICSIVLELGQRITESKTKIIMKEVAIAFLTIVNIFVVSAKKHLTHDYELEEKPTGFIPHFWDTIDALGGWKGISLIAIGILIFQYIVAWAISSGRAKREAVKKKREINKHL